MKIVLSLKAWISAEQMHRMTNLPIESFQTLECYCRKKKRNFGRESGLHILNSLSSLSRRTDPVNSRKLSLCYPFVFFVFSFFLLFFFFFFFFWGGGVVGDVLGVFSCFVVYLCNITKRKQMI